MEPRDGRTVWRAILELERRMSTLEASVRAIEEREEDEEFRRAVAAGVALEVTKRGLVLPIGKLGKVAVGLSIALGGTAAALTVIHAVERWIP